MKNEEDMATLETVENDEEEGRDVVPPMKKVRSKQVSDVTGFASFTGAEFNMTGSRAKPRRYRAKSDAALMIALPEKTVEGRLAYHASIDSRYVMQTASQFIISYCFLNIIVALLLVTLLSRTPTCPLFTMMISSLQRLSKNLVLVGSESLLGYLIW